MNEGRCWLERNPRAIVGEWEISGVAILEGCSEFQTGNWVHDVFASDMGDLKCRCEAEGGGTCAGSAHLGDGDRLPSRRSANDNLIARLERASTTSKPSAYLNRGGTG